MAGPTASFIKLPSDTANTGKQNRTQTKVVGSDTVHEHFMVPSPNYTRTGRYIANSTAVQAISSAAQTPSTAGMYYLFNSTANTAVGLLRTVDLSYGVDGTTAVAITQSPATLMLQKYTFNVAHSGTTLNIVATQTSSTTPKLNFTAVPTGATITLVGPIASNVTPALVSTASGYGSRVNIYNAGEEYTRGSAVEIAPGEGVVLHQITTGLATDSRRFTARFVWDEIDVS